MPCRPDFASAEAIKHECTALSTLPRQDATRDDPPLDEINLSGNGDVGLADQATIGTATVNGTL